MDISFSSFIERKKKRRLSRSHSVQSGLLFRVGIDWEETCRISSEWNNNSVDLFYLFWCRCFGFVFILGVCVCVVFLAERSTIDILNCLRQIVERQNGKLFQFGSSFSTKGWRATHWWWSGRTVFAYTTSCSQPHTQPKSHRSTIST